MYAVEFDTLIKDKFIEIPDYKKFQSQNVKVIILAKDFTKKQVQSKEKSKDLKCLFENPIVVDSYKHIAKREEIYDR